MSYTWNSLRFDVPAGLVDQTVVTLVDNPEAPTFTITLANDPRGQTAFGPYVEAQLQDLARSLPGYAAGGRKEERVNDRAAVIVDHKARSPQGETMRQRQAYVDAGASVAIVTVTCTDKPHAKADQAFEQILRSLGA